MMNLFLIYTGAFGLACTPISHNSAQEISKPNLLIIHTDEHNFRTLGCYRETLSDDQALVWGKEAIVETSHIDRLAHEGVLCANYYATSPVCTPSRASMVTGLYPFATGAIRNNIPLNDDVITFAHILKEAGYATSYVGKWHLDGDARPGFAPDRKFGFDDNRYMINRGHWKTLGEDEEGLIILDDISPGGWAIFDPDRADETSYTTDFLTDRTLEILERDKEKPFAIMLSIPDPHGPDVVRRPYNEMYTHMTFEEPPTMDLSGREMPGWNTPDMDAARRFIQDRISEYFGMVKCIDDNVGRILDYLEAEGLAENTIVVFTADHGDLMGEHGRVDKGLPYEASAKVPFLLRYPGKVKPGKQIEKAYTLADFTPTILGLMGVDHSAYSFHGIDASSDFTSSTMKLEDDRIVFMTNANDRWVAAVNNHYKLVLSPSDTPWLFDLKRDPDERVNFYNDPEYHTIANKFLEEIFRQMELYLEPVNISDDFGSYEHGYDLTKAGFTLQNGVATVVDVDVEPGTTAVSGTHFATITQSDIGLWFNKPIRYLEVGDYTFEVATRSRIGKNHRVSVELGDSIIMPLPASNHTEWQTWTIPFTVGRDQLNSIELRIYSWPADNRIDVDDFILTKEAANQATNNYYVSSSTGDDANVGSIEHPWRTMDRVSEAFDMDRNGGFIQPGDSILFKAGDMFEGQLRMNRSGNETNPIVISRYGAGEMPIFSGSGNIPGGDFIEVIRMTNTSHIVLEGLWIKNDRKNKGTITWGTNSSQGIKVIANKWGGIIRGLTFRNLKITDIFGVDMLDYQRNFTRDWYSAHGIFLDSEKNDLESNPIIEIGIEDVLIEDCYFYNIGTTAISTRHLTNVRNNPIDDEDRNKNFVIRNNTFEQLGGDGIVLASVFNALVEKNDFIDLGWGDHQSSTDRYFGRGEGCWTWNARNVIVQFNRQYRARGYGDTYGVGHIDFFSHNNIFQYNYSEDTEGGFIEILGDCHNNTFRYNISVNDGFRENGHNRYSIWVAGYVGTGQTPVRSNNTYIYGNTIYLDDAKYKPRIMIWADNTYVYNNIFYAVNGASIGEPSAGQDGVIIDIAPGSELVVDNNLFFGNIASSFTNLDNNRIIGDPQFVNPFATDELGRSSDGFKLQSTSPAVDAGRTFPEPTFPMAGQGIFKNISLHTATDYYGNPVDINNLVPNIGADNSHNSGSTVGVHFVKRTDDLFSIYPNPVRDVIHVNMKHELEGAVIEIYSVHGQLIKKEDVNTGGLEMHIRLPHNMGNGIYFLKVTEGDYYQVERFILYN